MMSDFEVGDWVVFINGKSENIRRTKSVLKVENIRGNELRYSLNGRLSVYIKSRLFRHATLAEIAAGNRIDVVLELGDRVQVYFYSCNADVTDGTLVQGAGTVNRVDDDEFVYGRLDSGQPFACPSIDVELFKAAVRSAFDIKHDAENQKQFIEFMKPDGVAFHFKNGELKLDLRQGRSVGLVVGHKWKTWNHCMALLKARQAEVDLFKTDVAKLSKLLWDECESNGRLYKQIREQQKRIDEQDTEIKQLKHINNEYQAMLKTATSALEKALGSK